MLYFNIILLLNLLLSKLTCRIERQN